MCIEVGMEYVCAETVLRQRDTILNWNFKIELQVRDATGTPLVPDGDPLRCPSSEPPSFLRGRPAEIFGENSSSSGVVSEFSENFKNLNQENDMGQTNNSKNNDKRRLSYEEELLNYVTSSNSKKAGEQFFLSCEMCVC